MAQNWGTHEGYWLGDLTDFKKDGRWVYWGGSVGLDRVILGILKNVENG